MLSLILITTVCAGVLIYEGRYMVRRKLWGEMVTVIVLVAIGFVLAAGPTLGITLPKVPKLIMRATNGLIRVLGIPTG